MTALLAMAGAIPSQVWVVIGSIFAAIGAFFFSAHVGRVSQEADDAKAALDASKRATETADVVSKLSPDQARQELQKEFGK